MPLTLGDKLLREYIGRHGVPVILNSGHGSQYTTRVWEELLSANGIRISGRSRRCKDNIWIVRLWRSIKQEYIYITPVDNATDLRDGIAIYMEYYNAERPHHRASTT